MNKTLKNNAGDSVVTFGICKSGKGERFHWKPMNVPHWDSLHRMKYIGPHYDCESHYVPMFLQVFWLGLIFYIKLHSRKISGHKMVAYNDTHFAQIDNALIKDNGL
jgi:hypothetical protein